MRAVEAYLSRRAQTAWPGAVVYREDDGRFLLERPSLEAVQLGATFPEAKRALLVLIAAARAQPDRLP